MYARCTLQRRLKDPRCGGGVEASGAASCFVFLLNLTGRPQKYRGAFQFCSGADFQCNLLLVFESDPFPVLVVHGAGASPGLRFRSQLAAQVYPGWQSRDCAQARCDLCARRR